MTEKVVFQSSSNLPPFEDKEIPLVSVDIYNKKNSRKFQHKMLQKFSTLVGIYLHPVEYDKIPPMNVDIYDKNIV